MLLLRVRKFSSKESNYWSNVAISCSQVFFGLFVATMFVGSFDASKMIIVLLSLVWSIIFWIIGWRIVS